MGGRAHNDRMDSCIALKGKGFIIMAADMNHGRSITTQLTDEDKILQVDSEKLINCVELDPGDRANFLEFVQKNLHLHEYRTGKKLSISATASWVRRQMADYLRSRTPFRVNMLLGGLQPDKTEAEGLDCMNKVIDQIKMRLTFSQPTFII